MDVLEWNLKTRLLLAIALGFLVGLERETMRSARQGLIFGGVRTFPLISLLGFTCAWLYQYGLTVMLPAGLLALGGLTGIAYLAKIRAQRYGFTSEVSALLVYLTGALALLADPWVAMALGVVNALLLSEKADLESYVERLNRVEFLAAVKFLLITLIILPALPNHAYTVYAINPFRIWQIVVLVSAIGFAGYLLCKQFGPRVGLWLSGLLGGIASSTATSVAAGRIAAAEPAQARRALQAMLLACGVMYLRLLVLVGLLNPSALGWLGWRLGLLAALGALLALSVRGDHPGGPTPTVALLKNPLELKPALVFAALFLALSVATQLISRTFGEVGLFSLAGVAGLVDVDPFILSLVQGAPGLSALAGPAIIVATLSNLLAKMTYFSVLAVPARRAAIGRCLLWALAHVPLLFV